MAAPSFYYVPFIILSVPTCILLWLGMKRSSEGLVDHGCLWAGLAMAASGLAFISGLENGAARFVGGVQIFLGGCTFGMCSYKLTQSFRDHATGQHTAKRPG